MEENNEIIICKSTNEEYVHKSPLLKSENIDIKPEKNDLEANELNVGTKLNNIRDETNNTNGSKVLKRKKTEDGVVIERVLSEGEASSDFETVSSIDSKVHIEDIEFSSSIDNDNDDDNYNIIIKVKNELAFQNKTRLDERFSYHESRSKSSSWQNQKTDNVSNVYLNRRHDNLESSRESKYWQRKNVDKNYNYGRRDRESSERKNFERSRQRTCNKDQSTYKEQDRRSGRNKWNSSEGRSRKSRSKDRISRFRGSRSSPRSFRNRSPNYKDTKKESRYLRSFERNSAKLSPERSSPPRKKRRDSPVKVSFASIWKKLNDRVPLNRIKKEETYNDKKSQRNYFDTPPRKKERTPFLVELERKLKEIDCLKNFKQEPNRSMDSTKASSSIPLPPPVIDQSSNSSVPLMCITTMPFFQGAVYPVPYPSIPAFSINNLPLVPGPTGLPVHVMANGEQIPHDMDGRPIPMGPNGYYLPVDPTGRLFAHIISPENQAVPIHMTEDGVLRLPNSEPVPFGPQHQFPINIDGRFIPIGPDSKPLYPCPDLPKSPPINFLPMRNPLESGQVAKTIPEPLPFPPETEFQEIVETKITETQLENQNDTRPPVIDLSLLNLIQNSSEEVIKAELLNKYKKKAQEKNEDVLRCKEIEKNLGVNPSKGGVKRSIPMKLFQKKNSRDDNSSCSSDMVLDSGDSDTTPSLKIVTKTPNKDPIEEITVNSDDEKNNLKIIYDKKVPKESNFETALEDYITEKVQQALKLLNEKKYEPPIAGRFIISNSDQIPSGYNSPNESPLLRNRIQLSFLTPENYSNFPPIARKETEARFKFLPQKNYFPKVKKQLSAKQKSSNSTPIPVFTFDFAVQCDFTSEIIRNLKSNVSRLEMEVTQLKLVNASLFDDFRNVQNARQKNLEELKKALLEIQDKNNQILSLKRSIETLK